MGRLVDIEDVKALINGLDSLPWEEEVDDLVDSIPTAYDVEKVVADIKSLSGYEIYKETFDLMIENIRKGGIDG